MIQYDLKGSSPELEMRWKLSMKCFGGSMAFPAFPVGMMQPGRHFRLYFYDEGNVFFESI